MAIHSDPTANAAVGSVNREWRQMVRRAIALRQSGREPGPEERSRFTGIYSQLLTESIDELEKMSKKG